MTRSDCEAQSDEQQAASCQYRRLLNRPNDGVKRNNLTEDDQQHRGTVVETKMLIAVIMTRIHILNNFVRDPVEHQQCDEHNPVVKAELDDVLNEPFVDKTSILVKSKGLFLNGVLLAKYVMHKLKLDFLDQFAERGKPPSQLQAERTRDVFIQKLRRFEVIGLAPNVAMMQGPKN